MVAWNSAEAKKGARKNRPGAMPGGSLPVAGMLTFPQGQCRQKVQSQVKATSPVWYLPGPLAKMTEFPKATSQGTTGADAQEGDGVCLALPCSLHPALLPPIQLSTHHPCAHPQI